nr:hypothetical protein [Clostridium botulinum]
MDIRNANGINGAVAQKLSKFLVRAGNNVKWIITKIDQIIIDANIKCSPFFA